MHFLSWYGIYQFYSLTNFYFFDVAYMGKRALNAYTIITTMQRKRYESSFGSEITMATLGI